MDLVAAYNFNEGSGTTVTDASGNGITGNIFGATWTTGGRNGNALSFNGSSSYVDLGNPALLQITGSMTWSAWVEAAANPADDGQIVAKSDDASGWQLKTSPDTGPHTFGVRVAGATNTLAQRYSTTVRSLNVWYHVAGVYNASAQTLDIYVNGVLDNGTLSGTIPASQINSAVNVNIGRRSGGFYFNGVIDDVRIYNRALSQAEIQADMNTPVGTPTPTPTATPSTLHATPRLLRQRLLQHRPPPPPVGLVAAYNFNEGSGTTVTDASGNGITGNIIGATWTTEGRNGNALSFNGSSSYVDLGNPALLQITGSMTMSAWVQAAANPADDGQIVAKSDDASGWQLKTSPDTGPHTFGVRVAGATNTLAQRYSTTVRSLNVWYHVAGVYNASAQTLDIYVNGVLDNGTLSGTIPASQINSAVNVNIGRRSGGYYFNGVIDDVRIYNRALSQAEIQADMNTPVGTPTHHTATLPL